MPSRNILKEFDIDSAYHIYNRGVAKSDIFIESIDYEYFMKIVNRYLDPNCTDIRGDGAVYEKYDLDIIAYCLMSNHFHFVIYQRDNNEIRRFMQSVMTAYSMYFNKKYERVGPVFQGRYKARRIWEDPDLLNLTRYIHMNPPHYDNYIYSSFPEYTGKRDTEWVRFNHLIDTNPKKYLEYLEAYARLLNDNPELIERADAQYDLN